MDFRSTISGVWSSSRSGRRSRSSGWGCGMAHDDRSAVEVLTPHREDGKTRHPSPTHDFLWRATGGFTLLIVAVFATQFLLVHGRFEQPTMLPITAFIAFGNLFLVGFGFHLLFGAGVPRDPRCPRCLRGTTISPDGIDFCDGCALPVNRCTCPDRTTHPPLHFRWRPFRRASP